MKKVLSMTDSSMSRLQSESAGLQAQEGTGARTAGEMLRSAREAAGLHIAALAVALKVPVKKLESLESDRFDLLPDAVFVRALASSICRTLKVDAAPVLERLPQTSRTLARRDIGLNTPFHAPSDGPGPSIWTQMSRPAVLAGLVLLLAALVLTLLPAIKISAPELASDALLPATPALLASPQDPANMSAAVLVLESTGSASPKPGSLLIEGAAPASLSAAMSASALVPVFTPSVAAAAPPVLLSASAVVAPMPGSGASAASAAASPGGLLVFTARADSWIEVTDGKGQVVLRRLLGAGEVVGATGALPLSAIVGRADATQVQVRGKAFDLSGLAKDNVARFEVK